jgi:hypothetical protein
MGIKPLTPKQNQAQAAVDHHAMAQTAQALRAGGGVFEGWQWWRGHSRVVWLPARSEVVFKIEQLPGWQTNRTEHEQMTQWRREGWEWSPETWLFEIEHPATHSQPVLAMPYYPCPVAYEEIPDSVHACVPDLFVANFARRPGGPVMVIDAGELMPRRQHPWRS